MKTRNRTHLAVLLFIIAIATTAGAQDWPQWRGANRDAKAAGFKAPAQWPKELAKKWRIPVGDGVSTPALVGDRLYVFTRQEGYEITRCLNAADGKEIWQDKYESLGAAGAAQSFSGPRSSPAVAQGKVVTVGVRGVVTCLDAASGKMLWRKDDFKAWPRFFPSSSPLIVNGLVIAQLGGQQNGALVAYDLDSGTEKWKWTGESPGYASPDVMTVGGTKLIIAETEQRIVAVNAADGTLVWETPYKVEGRGYNASTPILDGQTLIYCGSGRGTRAVKIQKEGDKFTAKELWSNPDKSVQFNTPVVKNGLIYGLAGNNEFFCLNRDDGKTLWSAPGPAAPQGGPPGGQRPPAAGQIAPAERPPGAGGQPAPGGPGGQGPGGPGGRRPGGGRGGMGGGMGGGGYGSIVDAGSVLLALTPSSQLIVFQPSDKELKQLATYKVADSPTHAYPVVSGNRIFIKDRDTLTLWTMD
jgi:outer membrane protein assembly factor BamB